MSRRNRLACKTCRETDCPCVFISQKHTLSCSTFGLFLQGFEPMGLCFLPCSPGCCCCPAVGDSLFIAALGHAPWAWLQATCLSSPQKDHCTKYPVSLSHTHKYTHTGKERKRGADTHGMHSGCPSPLCNMPSNTKSQQHSLM